MIEEKLKEFEKLGNELLEDIDNNDAKIDDFEKIDNQEDLLKELDKIIENMNEFSKKFEDFEKSIEEIAKLSEKEIIDNVKGGDDNE